MDSTAFYSVEIAINGTDCTFSDDILIEFFDNPIPVPVVDEITRCSGLEVTLEVEVNNSDIPDTLIYTWEYDGNVVQTGPDSTFIIAEGVEQFGEYTITVVDGRGCMGETTITTVRGVDPVVVPVESLVDKCINEDIALSVEVPNSDQLSNDLTYNWYINDTLEQSSSDNTFIHVSGREELVVSVEVIDEETQCFGTSQINVVYYENANCVDVPQGLSPNGDGFNDCLILDHLEDREDIVKAEVFNRYGTKVYELNDYVDQWCGTDQDGTILPVGTYFYIIYFNSSREPITSWIYLNY